MKRENFMKSDSRDVRISSWRTIGFNWQAPKDEYAGGVKERAFPRSRAAKSDKGEKSHNNRHVSLRWRLSIAEFTCQRSERNDREHAAPHRDYIQVEDTVADRIDFTSMKLCFTASHGSGKMHAERENRAAISLLQTSSIFKDDQVDIGVSWAR